MILMRKEDMTAIDFSGLNILDYTAEYNEKSSFAVIKVPPHVSHQLSWSTRSDKYYYVMDGTIDFTINDEDYSLNKGDFCIIKKGETFNYRNNSEDEVSLILVHTPHFMLDKEVFK
ncbi:MAG: cupin domain-containing protein [Spirochaetales bacterium]|nr:cupin domain-containing protein [Spirochaetales bacterium]